MYVYIYTHITISNNNNNDNDDDNNNTMRAFVWSEQTGSPLAVFRIRAPRLFSGTPLRPHAEDCLNVFYREGQFL